MPSGRARLLSMRQSRPRQRNTVAAYGVAQHIDCRRIRARHTLFEASHDGMIRLPFVGWSGGRKKGRVNTCGASEVGRRIEGDPMQTFNERPNNTTWGSERPSSTTTTACPHYPEHCGFLTNTHESSFVPTRLVFGKWYLHSPSACEICQLNALGASPDLCEKATSPTYLVHSG